MNKGMHIRLQLFADSGDRTEKATPKKRQDARKKGQVLQSREIVSATVLIFVFIGLRIFGSSIYGQLSEFFRTVLEEYAKSEDLFTYSGLTGLFIDTAAILAKTTGPVMLIAMISGLIGGYAQVGFLFTLEPIAFKFNRINPLNGLKRVFSMQGAVELAKAVLKIAIIGYIAYAYMNSEKQNILHLMEMDVPAAAKYIGVTSVNIAIRMCMGLVILGVFDYGYQWWEYEKNLRMSKQELKEEYKQTEGNPEIKSRIKQKQRQISMRRMMHEVPKADVVITNPTHYAVAVSYDAGVSDAPMVIAKGQDFIAARIKEAAKENKVEIVENRELARALYDTVDIGQAIPPELYQAVAEVLAFVYSLKGETTERRSKTR